MNRSLLSVEDFSLSYGAVPALHQVSIRIARGESLVIVGESGSGKSSLGLAVMRLLPRTARMTTGTIRFLASDGTSHELTTTDATILQRLRGKEIGMIFQEPMTSLNPVYRIGDQITEAIRFHEALPRTAARDRAVALLAHLGIAEPERRMAAFPHELSGGLRQRVVIAIALVCNPSLLIADEPTTALDVTVQAQILDLLKRLRGERGMALLFVTHHLGVAREIADRILVLYAGRAVEEGPAAAVIAHPLHPYTRALLQSVPRLGMNKDEMTLPAIGGAVPDPAQVPHGCAFAPRCPSFRSGLCDAAPPPVTTFGENRSVRCFRAAELAA
ncbi:MAG: ABC transporter ATP-binding protein [Rhodospirillales bacterium]|nr:ABC transporter ATP-binding protein [Rhodospirillales bacterium]